MVKPVGGVSLNTYIYILYAYVNRVVVGFVYDVVNSRCQIKMYLDIGWKSLDADVMVSICLT